MRTRHKVIRSDTIRLGLLTAPKLAPIVERELELRGVTITNNSIQFLRNHDLIVCDVPNEKLKTVMELQTVEDVFQMLFEGRPAANKEQLKKLLPRGFREEIIAGLTAMPPRPRKKTTTNVAVFVKQNADHEIYRREIERVVTDFIGHQFKNWKLREPADVELWAFLVEGLVSIGLRLTTISHRKRQYRDEERPGSLRPVLAGALVVMSEPGEDDTVLDPMCGSGTVLFERVRWGKFEKLIGVEQDRDAAILARETSEKMKRPPQIFIGDSLQAKTFAGHGQFSRIICNLPFGKQFEGGLELYTEALQCWRKLLKHGGFITVLTPDEKSIKAAAKAAHMRCKWVGQMRIKGLLASIFRVRP